MTELCDRYVSDNKFPCAQVQISHRGEVVLRHSVGKADIETGRALHDKNFLVRVVVLLVPVKAHQHALGLGPCSYVYKREGHGHGHGHGPLSYTHKSKAQDQVHVGEP